MKLRLYAIGKLHEHFYREGVAHYQKRIERWLSVEWRELNLPKSKQTADASLQAEREAGLLTAQLKPADYLVLFDEGGHQLSSEGLAQWLKGHTLERSGDLVWALGGAYGFTEALRSRARERLSLSPMTFPHQLARLIVVEQLYRALSILHGQPYHHA
jgi:23S rRNA (pseudouridine1915-N3)-methyltransferase